MLNIEKYKDDILEKYESDITCCVRHVCLGEESCMDDCSECKKHAMQWLLSEYKEPILEDAEKEYLSAVIKPFRKKVMDVVKTQYSGGKQSIRIRICAGDYVELPLFNNNTMYKEMEVGKYYMPEELGL